MDVTTESRLNAAEAILVDFNQGNRSKGIDTQLAVEAMRFVSLWGTLKLGVPCIQFFLEIDYNQLGTILCGRNYIQFFHEFDV